MPDDFEDDEDRGTDDHNPVVGLVAPKVDPPAVQAQEDGHQPQHLDGQRREQPAPHVADGILARIGLRPGDGEGVGHVAGVEDARARRAREGLVGADAGRVGEGEA